MPGYLDMRVGDVVGRAGDGVSIYDATPGGWFALRVLPQREDQAEAWLRRRGVYAFHPVLMRRSVVKGRVREYPRRYLPGYVFARFPGAPVVHRVVACAFITGALALQSGEWGRLDPRDLRAIHAMRKVDAAKESAAAAAKARRRQAVALRPGDAALFRGGPFAGLRCEVAALSGDAGVVVRIAMFGGDVSAQACVDDLVRVKNPLTGGAGRA